SLYVVLLPDSLFFPSACRFMQNPLLVLCGPFVSLSSFGAVIVTQIYRYRVLSTPTQRQQTKWVFFGFSFVLACFIMLTILFQILFPQFNQPNTLDDIVPLLTFPLVFLVFPMSVGIAILRYRLW